MNNYSRQILIGSQDPVSLSWFTKRDLLFVCPLCFFKTGPNVLLINTPDFFLPYIYDSTDFLSSLKFWASILIMSETGIPKNQNFLHMNIAIKYDG